MKSHDIKDEEAKRNPIFDFRVLKKKKTKTNNICIWELDLNIVRPNQEIRFFFF